MKTLEEIKQFLDDNSVGANENDEAEHYNEWENEIHVEWTDIGGTYILFFGDKPSEEEMASEDFGFDDEASFDSIEDLLYSIENYKAAGLQQPTKVIIYVNENDNKLVIYEEN